MTATITLYWYGLHGDCDRHWRKVGQGLDASTGQMGLQNSRLERGRSGRETWIYARLWTGVRVDGYGVYVTVSKDHLFR